MTGAKCTHTQPINIHEHTRTCTKIHARIKVLFSAPFLLFHIFLIVSYIPFITLSSSSSFLLRSSSSTSTPAIIFTVPDDRSDAQR